MKALKIEPDFYPRPPRGGRHHFQKRTIKRLAISIHALREEGDGSALGFFNLQGVISIHALREEGDIYVTNGFIAYKIFLSTPSARRATQIGPGGGMV